MFLLAIVWFVCQNKIVIFYTEILTGKIVLWCFFSSKTSEKIHNSTFLVKISDTEILNRKVELGIFSLVSLVKKHHNTIFPVKISV